MNDPQAAAKSFIGVVFAPSIRLWLEDGSSKVLHEGEHFKLDDGFLVSLSDADRAKIEEKTKD